MWLEVGNIVKTNYGTGPYRIIDITRGCECPPYLREIEGDYTPSPPHMHLTVLGMVDHHKGKTYWLNGYDEDLKSVWDDDFLIICPNDRPVQISLFR